MTRNGGTIVATAARVACLVLLSGGAAAAGDPAAGKRKTVTCNGCHGQASMKAVPNLGGQTPDYFVTAMRAYQDGGRAHATMRDVARILSVREFRDLAAHYAQPAAEAGAPSSAEAPAPAAATACSTCHGPGGTEPVTAETPRLAGQKSRYVGQVLREYRDGTRVHALMNAQARALTDPEIDDLARYFESRAGLFVR